MKWFKDKTLVKVGCDYLVYTKDHQYLAGKIVRIENKEELFFKSSDGQWHIGLHWIEKFVEIE